MKLRQIKIYKLLGKELPPYYYQIEDILNSIVIEKNWLIKYYYHNGSILFIYNSGNLMINYMFNKLIDSNGDSEELIVYMISNKYRFVIKEFKWIYYD